ncbi:uncharacterized protein DEA37_0009913 [Paragonimus westermani]|uniref:Uncharacterized protein n=1 Tax=Paragonimus westermani TaxID=34504 RepID=A0A5J4NHB6_9TREM|nr:uncharacterized protein DEA37_0009913 [Paragonimus westermani]
MDFMSVHNYCQKFSNLLQNQRASSDIQLIALEARLMGQFGLVFPYDFIDSQIKRACESLTTTLSAFRDESTITRELASLTLPSALGLAATCEQRHRLGLPVVDRLSTYILGYDLYGSSTTADRHGTGQDAHAMSIDLEGMNGGLPSTAMYSGLRGVTVLSERTAAILQTDFACHSSALAIKTSTNAGG